VQPQNLDNARITHNFPQFCGVFGSFMILYSWLRCAFYRDYPLFPMFASGSPRVTLTFVRVKFPGTSCEMQRDWSICDWRFRISIHASLAGCNVPRQRPAKGRVSIHAPHAGCNGSVCYRIVYFNSYTHTRCNAPCSC